jgi:hypothetical protein
MMLALLLLAQADYWPMEAGRRWELRSPATAKPMVFEVTRVRDGLARVRWENPWVKAEFGFRRDGPRVLLSTLDMGSGVKTMPPATAYFDFSAAAGKSWSNALGTMTVLRRDGETIEIRARDPKGADTFWTFGAGVGPVRFGSGKDAFVLSGRTEGRSPTGPAATGPAFTNPAIGIDANPTPGEGYSREAREKRLRLAKDAGAGLLYWAPKWNELSGLEERAGWARQFGMALALNLRIIDTHARTLPVPFSSPRAAELVTGALRELARRTGGEVKWLTLGNEVDAYFGPRRDEIPHYAELIRRVLPEIRRLFPKAGFAVNVTYGGLGLLPALEPILAQTTLASFTYYPLTADFRMRDPAAAGGEIRQMADAAGGKPMFLQEAGYASAGSETDQAKFVQNVLGAVRASRAVVGVNFVWMSDLPDTVVEDLVRYYPVGAHRENFRAYLATLGFFDQKGRAKPAWEAFRRGAQFPARAVVDPRNGITTR